MGIYVEELLVYGPGLSDEGREWLIYSQPTWRYLTGQALEAITLHTRPIERVIEAIARRVRPAPAEDEHHIPFGPGVDLWIFDFRNHDRTELHRFTAN